MVGNLKYILGLVMLSLLSCKEDTKHEANKQAVSLYHEHYRPQYHFTPEKMWMNDPNGLVFYEGEYHLFYQYYADDLTAGPRSWGHAVSSDLMRWQQLPIAIKPDSLGEIYSGSAVVDWKNSSGFGSPANPPLIAIFTYHNAKTAAQGRNDVESQAIAYSVDKGRTWTKFADNPVIKNPGIRDFRDPKVIWHEPSQRWVLVLAASDRIFIYNSINLRAWEKVSEFTFEDQAGTWECPDLFPLEFEGQEEWVLLVSRNRGNPNGGSGTQYFIGRFDGKTFVNSSPSQAPNWLDYGKDNYAGVTWSDAPNKRGQRTMIGWMNNWQYAQALPTTPWRGCMTLPRLLNLSKDDSGMHLITIPIPTVTTIRKEAVAFSRVVHREDLSLMENVKNRNGRYEVQLEFERPDSGELKVEIFNAVGDLLYIGYNANQNEYFIDRLTAGTSDFSADFPGRHVAPCYYRPGTIKMHLFFDVASVELFADDGRTILTDLVFPREPYTDITIDASATAPVTMIRGRVFELGSVW